MYHWISLLNKFDDILEKFCDTYKLEDPQVLDFACTLLIAGTGETEPAPKDDQNLVELGFSSEGDRELIESILEFSRMLLQNCGNRSIYGSSSQLNKLLNSTSLSLLESTLQLGSELAQRYQVASKRMNIPGRQVSNALLTNHYNIGLDRVLHLASPFSKSLPTPTEITQPTTPATPSAKGKEKASFNASSSHRSAATTVYANDLVSMVKGGSGIGDSPKSIRNGVNPVVSTEVSWDEWGDVKVSFYTKSAYEDYVGTAIDTPASYAQSPSFPTTPTPSRRSNLGPQGSRPDRASASDESPSSLPRASTFPTTNAEDEPQSNFKIVHISSSKVKSTGLHALLAESIPEVPAGLRYELLTKLRVAKALTTSLESRRQILAIRLLAITNLAYIHQEPTFLDTVMKQDNDEPRRLQLIYQLAELVHPPAEGDIAVPRAVQTCAFSTLDAFASLQTKFSDVCAALNTNINHGVLLYVVRKAVAEMGKDDDRDQRTEDDAWRDALISLLQNLSSNPRTGADLVTAGLIPILVEVVTLRTTISERYQPDVLAFLDAIMYSARDAFQTLVNANGLDAVSDLIVYEVESASKNSASGQGMPPAYRSSLVDYDIPYFQQQTMKGLFKFIHHMMSTAGVYGGNFDRLLRNLMDSPQLLGSLRQIIGNATLYGSTVWTHAVSILNDFINNEPTSFAVIAEAGLSRGLLEAVTGTTIVMPSDSKSSQSQTDPPAQAGGAIEPPAADSSTSAPFDDEDDEDDGDDEIDDNVYEISVVTPAMLQAPRTGPLARGIMPTSETINIIPQAFSAICLNTAGMKMFQASKALETFFEIFESPEHVKCMETSRDLPSSLGTSFDELVRHHPPLKDAIMTSIFNMVARVDYMCKSKAENNKVGAKLWTTDASGKLVVANGSILQPDTDRSAKGKGKAVDEAGDIEMQDAGSLDSQAASATPADINSTISMTPYITALAAFLSAMFSNTSVRADFCMKGGAQYVLSLATSSCLSYDFADSHASHSLHQVIALLAEAKPHLVMPSLLKSAQAAADDLQDFSTNTGDASFFAAFVNSEARDADSVERLSKGTKFVKAFVNLQSLILTINGCFQNPNFNHRSTNTIFTQVNVADYYVRFVKSLGPLLGACLRESMRLQKSVPDHWKHIARVKDTGFGEMVPEATSSVESATPAVEGPVANSSSEALAESASSGDNVAEPGVNGAQTAGKPSRTITKAEQSNPFFRNWQTLHYLVSRLPKAIAPFFQTLGKALVAKRSPDSFQKQGHLAIADALAESVLDQLSSAEESKIVKFSYWIGILHCLKDVLIEGIFTQDTLHKEVTDHE